MREKSRETGGDLERKAQCEREFENWSLDSSQRNFRRTHPFFEEEADLLYAEVAAEAGTLDGATLSW